MSKHALLFYSLVLCWVTPALAGRQFASLCGYRIAEHEPSYTIGRIATAAAYDPSQLRFFFPTVVSVSLPRQNASYLANVYDGVIRTGAARFSDGTLKPMETDEAPSASINDVAVLSLPQQTISGPALQPVTAIANEFGRILLYFPSGTETARQYVKTERDAKRQVDVRDNYGIELDAVQGERFSSVAMVALASPLNLRVFGLTESGVYSLDIDLADRQFNSAGIHREWKLLYRRDGGRYVRALDPDTFVIGDEVARLEVFHKGRASSLGMVPGGWLRSFSPFRDDRGDLRIATLSFSYEKDSKSSVHLWDGVRFEPIPINFPEDEIPMAIATTSLPAANPSAWASWKAGDDYKTGHLSEMANNCAFRFIFLTRAGTDYRLRGLQGFSSGRYRLSNFPWYYIGGDYTSLEKKLAQAGFNIPTLRAHLDIKADVGSLGEKLAIRLREDHGFEPFDPTSPERYKGSVEMVTGAWINRLAAQRDLRLERARVSQTIADTGIIQRRDQMLVYELMNLEEQHRNREPNFDSSRETSPSGDQAWLEDFQIRLSEQASPLVQSSAYQYQALFDYHQRNLKGRTWEEFIRLDLDQIDSEAGKILFLLSQEYFERPFLYQVQDYLAFCRERGLDKVAAKDPWDKSGERLWVTLVDYLESRDPLRKVIDNDTLLKFLLGR